MSKNNHFCPDTEHDYTLGHRDGWTLAGFSCSHPFLYCKKCGHQLAIVIPPTDPPTSPPYRITWNPSTAGSYTVPQTDFWITVNAGSELSGIAGKSDRPPAS